jgi:hypothetical protein
VTPRYEFRLFDLDRSCDAAAGKLADHLQYIATDDSAAVYLISPDLADVNVKIRDGKLDVKMLIERHMGLELWRPSGRYAFPLTNLDASIRALGLLLSPMTHSAAPGPDGFIAAAEASPRFCVMHVSKRRMRFAASGVHAEVAQVQINGATTWSLAIESASAADVVSLLEDLSLHRAENVSYPRMLQRLCGMIPLPPEHPARVCPIPATAECS